MRRIGELVPRPAVAWFAVALVVRAFVCWRTPVPSHDVHYLWMGERLAADGDLGAAFTTPHHPLYGILVGAMLRLWPALGGVGAWIACRRRCSSGEPTLACSFLQAS